MTGFLLTWLWFWGVPVTWHTLVAGDEKRVTLGWSLVATLWPITVPVFLAVGAMAHWAMARRKAKEGS